MNRVTCTYEIHERHFCPSERCKNCLSYCSIFSPACLDTIPNIEEHENRSETVTYVTAQPTVIQENIQMSEHKKGKHSGHEIESILGSIE
jgi:hypothetical protein